MTRLQDYGKNGLIGVLTPQANTTVEPELWALLPHGWSLLNARLTSSRGTIEERLVEYTEKFLETAEQFANAPVEAIGIACTGASYLIGSDEERRILDAMEQRFKVPCVTSATASAAALRALGAKHIALLTPYPQSLTELSIPYWESQGFKVVAKTGPDLENDAFHPIYAMGTDGVFNAYQRLHDGSAESGADAVLMLGTGMATLAPLLRGSEQGFLPALSCNLALTWACVNAVDSTNVSANTIVDWLKGGIDSDTGRGHWAARLQLLF